MEKNKSKAVSWNPKDKCHYMLRDKKQDVNHKCYIYIYVYDWNKY